MTGTAVALVLVAAFSHAGWNLLTKRLAGYDVIAFQWLVGLCGLVFYAALAGTVIMIERPRVGPLEIGFIAGSALLHQVYFMLLQRGYRVGDLSLVYPLARGSGPLLAGGAAVLLLGERPGPLGIAGILLVGAGVIVLGWPASGRGRMLPAVWFGLATGLFIAAYTVWDKYAISVLMIPPIVYNWANEVVRTAALTPFAMREPRRAVIRELWQRHRREVLICAVLMPLSYLLVLTAMRFTPVSAIAPAREVSVLLGVALGGRLLAEGHLPRRMLAAAAVAGGVVAIALG